MWRAWAVTTTLPGVAAKVPFPLGTCVRLLADKLMGPGRGHLGWAARRPVPTEQEWPSAREALVSTLLFHVFPN